MPRLSGQTRFSGDDGSADPGVAGALAAYAAGRGSEHAALIALARSRLLVPVVPMPPGQDAPAPGSGACGHEGPAGQHGGATEMALPRLVGRDGRSAILAFSCLDALTRWQPAARPVPAEAPVIWRTAAEESCAVVIDVAGPVPLAVEGARLTALASGASVPSPYEDPDVRDAIGAAVTAHAPGAAFVLRPAAADGDLVLELALPSGLTSAQAAETAGRAGQAAMAALGGRLRRGIAIALR